MYQQIDFLIEKSGLAQATCQQYLLILKRLAKSANKSYRQISVNEIETFIALLPGSMKPQAFAAVKLLYGKFLYQHMDEDFKQQWPRIAEISAKQRKRLPENSLFTKAEVSQRIEKVAIDLRCIMICIFAGMRMQELLSLTPKSIVNDSCLLTGRKWDIPHEILEDMKLLSERAKRENTKIFPLTRAGYMRKLRSLGLSVRQLRTSGIADAFKNGRDAYKTWNQFGIFEGQQQAKYWKLYGAV